ncbi:3-deoxy-D-manno-octulosonic acid transferase [soil metagenome]
MNHWDATYLAAAPVFLSAAYYKRARHGKYRRSLPGMFGANLPSPPLPAHRERAWLHSVSVGESVAAGAVFKRLQSRFPEWQFLSTTATETGQDQAKRSLAGANNFDFAPVDLSWKVDAFLRAYNPSLYLFFETEIWPNTLTRCGALRMPVFLVNGKLSERSGRRYAKLRGLFQPPLSNVTAFLMQTEADAERMRSVAGPRATIHVTGNVKFDNLPTPLSAEEKRDLRAQWGVSDDAFLLLAGSTHPREEPLILAAFDELKKSHPAARLAIAPRHPERFTAVADEIAATGRPVWRASTGAAAEANGDAIILLDQMGVLARSFGAADVALVGGSWNPIGGHNLLEAAAHGIPVVHGPHMHAQKEIMRVMGSHAASVEASERKLPSVLVRLAADANLRADLGRRGQQAAVENRGAADRSVAIIANALQKKAPA